jgi:hypothetical protein
MGIKGGFFMRTFILVLLALFLLTVPTFAAEPDWINVPIPEPVSTDVAWHFSPANTKFNPQGRLETWVKREYIGTGSVPGYLGPGDYAIWVVYVDPSFEKECTTKITEYKKDGTIKRSRTDFEWRPLAPGSDFEKCLQGAYNYAKQGVIQK